jgi:HlyD family secretion protein
MNAVRKEWAQLDGISQVLGIDEPRAVRPWQRPAVWVTAAVLVALVVAGIYRFRGGPEVRYVTESARRGDLTVTVTATGTIFPNNQVGIISEIPGTVRSVLASYNDAVHAGQVLARLDTSRLEALVRQSKAAIESATAGVLQAKATASDAQSQLARLQEVRKLSGGKVPSKQEYANARTAVLRANAAVISARAAVEQARVTLETQQNDLAKGVIVSPINGIVLTCDAWPGQTVAASTPVLFTVAEDLSRMQLVVDVDEADVGQVHAGEDASIMVDGWPDRNFPAKVTQVRYGAKTLQGVVTYETVLAFDNSARLLRPSMTATALIVVGKVDNGILVPNAALRYEPPAPKEHHTGGLLQSLLSKHHRAPPAEVSVQTPGSESHVWVLRNGHPALVKVQVGRSDGSWTEVHGVGIDPGVSLIVDTITKPS